MFFKRNRSGDLHLGDLLAQLGKMIALSKTGPRTEEVRQFIRKHKDVPEFKDLACTLILLAEDFRAQRPEEWKLVTAQPSSFSVARFLDSALRRIASILPKS